MLVSTCNSWWTTGIVFCIVPVIFPSLLPDKDLVAKFRLSVTQRYPPATQATCVPSLPLKLVSRPGTWKSDCRVLLLPLKLRQPVSRHYPWNSDNLCHVLAPESQTAESCHYPWYSVHSPGRCCIADESSTPHDTRKAECGRYRVFHTMDHPEASSR